MYNMTNLTSANNLFEIFKATNDSSMGIFSALFLLTLLVILMFNIYKNDMRTAFLAASFVVMLVSILMMFIGIITFKLVILAIVLVVVAIILSIFTR